MESIKGIFPNYGAIIIEQLIKKDIPTKFWIWNSDF